MKNNVYFMMIAVAAVLLAACSSSLRLSDELSSNADVMKVNGRNKAFNRQLSFGEFRTGKVQGGWVKGSGFTFVIDVEKQRQKFRFDLNDSKGNQAEVYCVSKLKTKELPSGTWWFPDIVLKAENSFTGAIVPADTTRAWRFFIENPDAALPDKALKDPVASGIIKGRDKTIEVFSLNEFSNGARAWGAVVGYEFRYGGKQVGAVDLNTPGKVILYRDAPAEVRFVIAGVASGLLLRVNLEDNS